MASAAALLSGCANGDDMVSAVQTSLSQPGPGAPAVAGPDAGGAQPGNLEVTGQQRAYLDALAVGGVHPSSDLLALSIGSYVCQARAAGQSDQAVWEFVVPLVRGDVAHAHRNSSMAAAASEVHAVTADYIRIATERLC